MSLHVTLCIIDIPAKHGTASCSCKQQNCLVCFCPRSHYFHHNIYTYETLGDEKYTVEIQAKKKLQKHSYSGQPNYMRKTAIIFFKKTKREKRNCLQLKKHMWQHPAVFRFSYLCLQRNILIGLEKIYQGKLIHLKIANATMIDCGTSATKEPEQNTPFRTYLRDCSNTKFNTFEVASSGSSIFVSAEEGNSV